MTAPSRSAGKILTRAIELLSSARALDEVTAIVADAARELAGADGATFVLREDDLCFYADERAIGPLWKGQRFPASTCISGWAMAHAQSVVVPDIFVDDRIPHDAYRPTFVKSLCMTPVRVEDPIAAIGTYWAEQHTPDDDTVRHLQILANSAAVALENLELRGAVSRRVEERDRYASRADELESAIHALVHDLRTPLTAMIGYADLLIEETPEGGEAQRHAGTIARAGQRMAAQIDRMLGIYRITQSPIHPMELDLTLLGRELADDFLAQAKDRSVNIDVEDGLEVVADPVLARLMLDNLLDNAVKYTAREDDARIRIGRVDHEHPLSTFAISDNGVGFDPGDATLLFQPLGRLHADQDFAGTGLGLASVARIVERHGGKVHAEGVPSVGASFFFSLPVPG